MLTEGEGTDGYRDQIVTVPCDVASSLHSKTHPLFMKYSIMAQVQSVMHTSIIACFLCFFYNPYMSLSHLACLYNIITALLLLSI